MKVGYVMRLLFCICAYVSITFNTTWLPNQWILAWKALYISSMHNSVEIHGFFCPTDFTWNQFEWMEKGGCKLYDNFRDSEFAKIDFT